MVGTCNTCGCNWKCMSILQNVKGRKYLPNLVQLGEIRHSSEHHSSVNLCRYNQNKTYIRSRTIMEILTEEYCGCLAVSRTVPVQ